MHNEYIRKAENSNLVLLFIHGFLGSPRHFDRFINAVSNDIAVYNVLLDGHGKTVKDFSKASMKKWENQIDGIMQKLVSEYESVIIVAHSMGTFFAMDAAIKYPNSVKALFLLASPLKIGVKPSAFINTVKSFFGKISKNDEVAAAYKNSHSVKLTVNFWEYTGWIPRYLELFEKSKKSREVVKNLSVPVRFYQSFKDELVSNKSVNYIPQKANITLNVLKNSAHFIYDEEDYKFLINEFKRSVEIV